MLCLNGLCGKKQELKISNIKSFLIILKLYLIDVKNCLLIERFKKIFILINRLHLKQIIPKEVQ